MSDKQPGKSRVHDAVGSALGICAAGILFSSPWNVDTSGPEPFYKGPLIFPLMALGLMVLSSLPSLWRLLHPSRSRAGPVDRYGFPYKTGSIGMLLIAFLVGIPYIGLEISTFAFLTISIYLLGHRSMGKNALLPLIMTGLIWFVFKKLLGVFFPAPLFLELFVN